MKKITRSLLLALLSAAFLLSTTACAAQSAGESGFSDVPAGAWYEQAVSYCKDNGLMSGTSETAFSPQSAMDRAMLVTVLHRLAGSPASSANASFSDVQSGEWYSQAVSWAADTGLVSGYDNGSFGPDDPITRQQLAALLWRYAGEPAAAQTHAFRDSAGISAYAAPAVAWAYENGIVTGKENNSFDPEGSATRAQAAVMLYRYLSTQKEPDMTKTIIITVNGEAFSAVLNDSAAARQFFEMLPLTVDMAELNGNEKFYDLPNELTTDDRSVGSVETGDLMLYSGNCLVLFYESFSTAYRYTPLGKISDPEGLKAAAGSGGARVSFAAAQPKEVGAFNFETKTVLLNSGYEMPILGLGTYSLLDSECVDSVTEVLQFGGRLIDTAYMYHNEEAVGEGIRASGVPRGEIFVTTKLYPNQYADAANAIDEALEKLGVEYIDLMLLHHPGAGDVAAYKAMEQAVADGKIRSIGLSNWYVDELKAFLPQITITPAVVQNEIHPYYQENDVIPYIQSLGIVVEGWYPLGGRGHTAELLGDETISAIAAAHGVSSAQVILRWNLQKGVVVIPGSSNPEHIKENLDLFGFELTDAEMSAINALNRDEKHDWY